MCELIESLPETKREGGYFRPPQKNLVGGKVHENYLLGFQLRVCIIQKSRQSTKDRWLGFI